MITKDENNRKIWKVVFYKRHVTTVVTAVEPNGNYKIISSFIKVKFNLN